ncbi:hypothetical protein TYRP_010476 [Tyrophagus putrescentiae]|nr:hypothetical protein TYRP_010476 [Tyrophagus putrescentiae]
MRNSNSSSSSSKSSSNYGLSRLLLLLLLLDDPDQVAGEHLQRQLHPLHRLQADLGQQLRVAELLQLLQVAVGAGEVQRRPLRRDALLPVNRQQVLHVAEEDIEALAVDRHRVGLA